jgi:hypothetical protein
VTVSVAARPGGLLGLIIDSGMEGGMQEAMDRLEQVAHSLR